MHKPCSAARLQRHRGEALVSSPASCPGGQACQWEEDEGTISHDSHDFLKRCTGLDKVSVTWQLENTRQGDRNSNRNRKKCPATASACAPQVAGLHLASSGAIHGCGQRMAEGGCRKPPQNRSIPFGSAEGPRPGRPGLRSSGVVPSLCNERNSERPLPPSGLGAGSLDAVTIV